MTTSDSGADIIEALATEVSAKLLDLNYDHERIVDLADKFEGLADDIRVNYMSEMKASEKRRLMFLWSAAGIVATAQATNYHFETCRVDEVISGHGIKPLSHGKQFACDATFPVTVHKIPLQGHHSLSEGNITGIIVYAALFATLIAWWVQARRRAKEFFKDRTDNALPRQTPPARRDRPANRQAARNRPALRDRPTRR